MSAEEVDRDDPGPMQRGIASLLCSDKHGEHMERQQCTANVLSEDTMIQALCVVCKQR